MAILLAGGMRELVFVYKAQNKVNLADLQTRRSSFLVDLGLWSADLRRYRYDILNRLKSKRGIVPVHPKKTYGPGLLKDLLADIGWSEIEMRKLKLIK